MGRKVGSESEYKEREVRKGWKRENTGEGKLSGERKSKMRGGSKTKITITNYCFFIWISANGPSCGQDPIALDTCRQSLSGSLELRHSLSSVLYQLTSKETPTSSCILCRTMFIFVDRKERSDLLDAVEERQVKGKRWHNDKLKDNEAKVI